jgi:hypothetical protein
MSHVRFETPVFLRGMFAFVRRRFAPLALSVDETFVSRKRLNEHEIGNALRDRTAM